MDDATLGIEGAQFGDFRADGIAGGNITNMHVSSDQAIALLADDMRIILERLERLEELTQQHRQERQALTRMLTHLASESLTISETHKMIERQMESERVDRQQRRRYLDTMLAALLILNLVNIVWGLRRARAA